MVVLLLKMLLQKTLPSADVNRLVLIAVAATTAGRQRLDVEDHFDDDDVDDHGH